MTSKNFSTPEGGGSQLCISLHADISKALPSVRGRVLLSVLRVRHERVRVSASSAGDRHHVQCNVLNDRPPTAVTLCEFLSMMANMLHLAWNLSTQTLSVTRFNGTPPLSMLALSSPALLNGVLEQHVLKGHWRTIRFGVRKGGLK